MTILLLAERLRVEERLLIEALGADGHDARLLTPAEIGGIAFGAPAVPAPDGALVLARLQPTREASALLWALETAGWRIVPGAAQMDAFARRDRLYRDLIRAGVPVAETILGWGTEAVLAAVDQVGWPVELLPLDGSEPGIVVEDREGAEAVVEHRAVLGREHVLLVRRAAAKPDERRLLVAGDRIFAARPRGEADWELAPAIESDGEIARQVAGALGAPLIDLTYLPDASGAVTAVMPVLGFRAIQSEDADVAAAIASFATGRGARDA